MKCPVCKGSTGFFKYPAVDPAAPDDILPYPLIQQSYPGQPGYISGRCSSCFDKAIKKEAKRERRGNSGKSFQKTVPSVPPGIAPTTLAICRSCFGPMDADGKLTNAERFTEQILRVCITCLNSVNAGVEKQLNREPDYDNAFLVNTGAAGLEWPRIWAIPMKMRPPRPTLLKRLFNRA